MDAFLNSAHINHNIIGSISHSSLIIGNCAVTSENGSFSIKMKITDGGVSITDSNVSSFSASPRKRLDSALKSKNVSSVIPKIDDFSIPKRNLRPRLNVSDNSVPKIKQVLTVAKSKSDYKNIDSFWQNCKREQSNSRRQIQVNAIVLAKVKGHSPWPAIVLNIINSKKAKVEFFGAALYERFGVVNIGELTLFEKSLDLIKTILNKTKNTKFRKGVQEVERILDVPSSKSICN